MEIKLTVNGTAHSDEVEPRLLLIHYLRETLGLRAANVGCDTTSCGACTVLLDGESVKSCTVLAVQANGRSVTRAMSISTPGWASLTFIIGSSEWPPASSLASSPCSARSEIACAGESATS